MAGSQKGLMLPPGLCFNALSEKAIQASKQARLPRSYWSWEEMLGANETGFFPYTPATNLLYGLKEAIDMLREEGLAQVFARHARLAEATRRAVGAWGLELLCVVPEEYSNSLTAVLMPGGHDADAFRALVLEKFNMSLGNGLGKVQGQGLPYRPPGRLQRSDAGRHARRHRYGPGVGGGAARPGRRPGGAGLSGRGSRRGQGRARSWPQCRFMTS